MNFYILAVNNVKKKIIVLTIASKTITYVVITLSRGVRLTH